MSQIAVKTRLTNVGKVLTAHREDGSVKGEVPFEENHLHKMIKGIITEVADFLTEVMAMTTIIIITTLITEVEDDCSNDDPGDPRDFNPGEEVIYLKQGRAIQSTDTYPNTDTYAGFVVTKVITTTNAIRCNI